MFARNVRLTIGFCFAIANGCLALDHYVAGDGVNSGPGTNPASPWLTIAYAVANSMEGDTINIATGIYTEANIVVATNNLTVTGAGRDFTIVQAATARGVAATRVFTLNAQCTLRGMTIRYGCLTNSATYGGGIALGNNSTYDVTIRECRIVENDTRGSTAGPNYGGAVMAPGSSATGLLTLVDCHVVSNSAVMDGIGALGADKKGIFVSNCVFEANSAVWHGGGIYLNSGPLEIYSSTITSNTTGKMGGGAYAGGNTRIADCTFSYNTSATNGGGLFWGDELNVINSTLAFNTAAGRGGGAVSGSAGVGGTQRFYNCTIAFNYATSSGGGLSRGAGILELYSTLVATNQSATSDKDIASPTIALCTNCLVGNNTGTALAPALPDARGNYIGSNSGPIDPMLEPLAYNGRLARTKTCAIIATNSMAYNHGTNILDLVYDQRGGPFNRVYSEGCDIGAYEYIPYSLLNASMLSVR